MNLAGELLGVPGVELQGLAYEGLGFAIGMATVRMALNMAGTCLAAKPLM